MIDINSFRMPVEHPYGMLEGYDRAYEKETVLQVMLNQCLAARDWIAVKTNHRHPTLVDDGLLEHVDKKEYCLTEKAKGLLYAYYHK